jgi:hypothetical protein
MTPDRKSTPRHVIGGAEFHPPVAARYCCSLEQQNLRHPVDEIMVERALDMTKIISGNMISSTTHTYLYLTHLSHLPALPRSLTVSSS